MKNENRCQKIDDFCDCSHCKRRSFDRKEIVPVTAAPPKKVPMRKCVGCNQMKPKSALVRVVKTKDGEIALDESQKQDGRGAYLCKAGDCLTMARKKGRLERAFRGRIPTEIYNGLEHQRTQNE